MDRLLYDLNRPVHPDYVAKPKQVVPDSLRFNHFTLALLSVLSTLCVNLLLGGGGGGGGGGFAPEI